MHQEANGKVFNCPVRALVQRVIHLQKNGARGKTFLSAFNLDGEWRDMMGEDISKGVKMAATLQYPTTRGVPIEQVDTHSLQSGEANVLALSGYTDTQIQKLGCWRAATFKEYIREELVCYSAGMSTNMKQNFKFVNISGNAYHDNTATCLAEEYNINYSAAA